MRARATALAVAVLFAGQTPAVAGPPVSFTHIFLDVRPATYQAIQTSKFLSGPFAHAEAHAIPATKTTPGWSGFYVFGKHTYLEFFSASATQPLAATAMGFQIDRRADLAALGQQIKAATKSPVVMSTQTRPIDGKVVNWFDSISADYGKDDKALTGSWVMAIYPDFVRRIKPAIAPHGDGVTAEENEFHSYGPDGDKKLFKDVLSVELEMPAAEIERLSREFAAYGYRATKNGNVGMFAGPDFTVILKPSAKRRSALYRLALNRAQQREERVRIGDSELRLHRGNTAEWRFWFD